MSEEYLGGIAEATAAQLLAQLKITLSPEELACLKDEAAFKAVVALRLSGMEANVGKLSDKLNGFSSADIRDALLKVDERLRRLSSIRGWVCAHTWWLGVLSALITVLLVAILNGKGTF